MQFPCEVIVREVLPAFKAFIVKELFHQYNLSQTEIANHLNITQASVSYYLRGERGRIGLEIIHNNEKIKNYLLSLTKDLANRSADPEIIVDKVCEICASMQGEFGCRGAVKK